MSLSVSRAHELLNAALDYRSMRQDLIAGNIANADTPFYRPRDVEFESMLAARKAEIFGGESARLEMAQTDGAHLGGTSDSNVPSATLFFRDGHMARNDGNSVDLDVETTEMAKNSVMFNAVLAAKKKGGAIYRSVIDASAKTS